MPISYVASGSRGSGIGGGWLGGASIWLDGASIWLDGASSCAGASSWLDGASSWLGGASSWDGGASSCVGGASIGTPSRAVTPVISGVFGSFRYNSARLGFPNGLAECARRCAECAACRYVSVATDVGAEACFWHTECDLPRVASEARASIAAAANQSGGGGGGVPVGMAPARPPSPHSGYVSVALIDALRFGAACRARYGAPGACG